MMMQWIFLFLFLSSSSQMPIGQSKCNHLVEISALLHFKDVFEINCTDQYGYAFGYPKTSTWDNAESLLNGTAVWDGVECDRVKGHVISLDLSSSCLRGSINSSTNSIFSHLVHLEHLNLAFNDFQGSSIPSEVGNLSRLTYLNLSSSYFKGRVPFEISKLSMLTSLDLSSSISWDLELNLKGLVRNMSNLEEFDLSYVLYPRREVPKLLLTNDMSSWRSLKFGSYGLYGEFPPGIFHLPKLQHLRIRGNWELEGHLPTEFNSSTTPLLESLVIGWTNFSGTIPVSIGNLVLLRELDLSYCKFTGPIPAASLSNLTHLISLDLSYNTFSPSNNFTTLSFWLGKLTNLKYLEIAGANLIGEIPPSSLENLTDLSFLGLSGNRLTGQIPSVLTNLTQLSYLVLGDNRLTGEIPPDGFVNLKYLHVAHNMLSGPLPIQTLRNLKELDVGYNNLSGALELDLFLEFTNLTALVLSFNNLTVLLQQQRNVCTSSTLPKLRFLELSSCQMSKFPEFLQHQHYLLSLDVSNNSIKGPIPKWIGSIKSLERLDVSHNSITGSVPVPPPYVVTYRASHNELSGQIPRSFCNLPSLQVLDISSNHFTGELDPHCFSKPSLKILNLRNNSFYGKIPEFCTSGTNFLFRMIDLNSNQFREKIPRSLANCAELQFFDAGSNLINDTFPYWLGSLRHLKVLLLKDNALHGSIGVMPNMTSGYWFSELIIIDLSRNSLSGNLSSCHFEQWMTMKMADLRNPSYIGQDMFGSLGVDAFYYSLTMYNKGTETEYLKIFNALITIDLSSNKFEGEIPSTIGDLRGLHFLNLSNNHLYGEIPSSLGNLTKLESLDLSSNGLFGQIPQQLTGLNFLSDFDVSHNNLTGLIPQGRHFDTFTNISFLGNPGLCGEPLSRKCAPRQETEQPPEEMARKEYKFWDDLNAKILWMVVSIGFGGGLVVGVAVENIVDWRMLILYFRSRNCRRGREQLRRN